MAGRCREFLHGAEIEEMEANDKMSNKIKFHPT
jgi:hypothetical protein